MKTKRIIGLIMLCFAAISPLINDALTSKGKDLFKECFTEIGVISFILIAICLTFYDEFYE